MGLVKPPTSIWFGKGNSLQEWQLFGIYVRFLGYIFLNNFQDFFKHMIWYWYGVSPFLPTVMNILDILIKVTSTRRGRNGTTRCVQWGKRYLWCDCPVFGVTEKLIAGDRLISGDYIWSGQIIATSHDLGPQEVAVWKGHLLISGISSLVKYHNLAKSITLPETNSKSPWK